MWALRRASNPLKGRSFSIRACHTSRANFHVAISNPEVKASTGNSNMAAFERCTCSKDFHCVAHGYRKFSMGWCSFSSQADSKSSSHEEEDLEDGFSELESPSVATMVGSLDAEIETGSEHGLISEGEVSEGDDVGNDGLEEPQDGLVLSDSEAPATEKKSLSKKASLALFMVIMEAPGASVQSALDKWVEEGKEVNRSEVSAAMLNLRRRKMYGRALQLSEWVEASKQFEIGERDYASRVDLLAKVRGLQSAESYIKKIPEAFRGEVIYRTLLANCVLLNNVKKAEEVFNKMKDLELPLTSFSCNQLLLLYKRIDKKKIADVLLLMEKENVKPTLFTYRVLIDAKGQSNDISGMDQIVEMMKAEGIKPDDNIHAALARHYVNSGLKDKAEFILKEMEGEDLRKRPWACQALLPLYAALGKADEVGRIWEICLSSPRINDCMAAIEAWGKLGKIEEAEAAFERMTKMIKKPTSKHYSALLRVYANHKMLAKGKDLVKQMGESGCVIGPLTWDAIVKLYVQAGEVEKADTVLGKATQQRQERPMFSTFMVIMDQYAKRGDVHNAEKMFFKLRQAGYTGRLRQFEALIQAYANAKVPAYGIRERMKADNVFPNKVVAKMLTGVDAFRKTAVSELLD